MTKALTKVLTKDEIKSLRKKLLEEYQKKGIKLTKKELRVLSSKIELGPLLKRSGEIAGKISGLTILSFGGGQDSTTLLLKYLYDDEFRKRYAGGHIVVVMSDTGDEHDYTYTHVEKMRRLCKEHGILFKLIKGSEGYHIPSWPSLQEAQGRPIGGKYKKTTVQIGTKSCTLNLKIDPIYKWLDEYINEWKGYNFRVNPEFRGCGKKAIKRFHKEEGKIRVLIGYAFNEEPRAVASKKLELKDYESVKKNGAPTSSWRKVIYREFPLIDLEMDRSKCQSYMLQKQATVMPSNCMRCPYMSDQEFLWLERNHPEKMAEWISWEESNDVLEKGVFIKETVRQRLGRVEKEYSGWNNEQLDDYKMSHGCETNSGY